MGMGLGASISQWPMVAAANLNVRPQQRRTSPRKCLVLVVFGEAHGAHLRKLGLSAFLSKLQRGWQPQLPCIPSRVCILWGLTRHFRFSRRPDKRVRHEGCASFETRSVETRAAHSVDRVQRVPGQVRTGSQQCRPHWGAAGGLSSWCCTLRYVGISLHKKPGSVHANVLAADAYLAKDDFPDAEAAARRALASAEGLGRDYDHATYDLGLVKLHTGYCEEAHEIGNTLSLYSNSNDKHEAHSLSIAQCDLTGYGDRFFSEGHPDWAIGFYNRALREKPDNYRAQVGLAKAYRAKGMQKEADEAAAKAATMRRPGST